MKVVGVFVRFSCAASQELIGFPLRSGYAASKHAIKGYLETLQCELFKTNITLSLDIRINTNISKKCSCGRWKAVWGNR
jgi:NAD(P)-dependent dehydrogenase (short-subunit alcohol dehydrogenase family)